MDDKTKEEPIMFRFKQIPVEFSLPQKEVDQIFEQVEELMKKMGVSGAYGDIGRLSDFMLMQRDSLYRFKHRFYRDYIYVSREMDAVIIPFQFGAFGQGDFIPHGRYERYAKDGDHQYIIWTIEKGKTRQVTSKHNGHLKRYWMARTHNFTHNSAIIYATKTPHTGEPQYDIGSNVMDQVERVSYLPEGMEPCIKCGDFIPIGEECATCKQENQPEHA